MRPARPLSVCVRVLYVESDEEMGMPRVGELTSRPVTAVHIDGLHVAALQSILGGENARRMAGRLEEFLMES